MLDKKLFLLFIILVLLGHSPLSAQMKFEGTMSPKKEVLALLEAEAKIMDSVRNVKQRDSLRRPFLSDAFFYHGLDGKPIGLEGLTKRQTKNNFQYLESIIISETLYQYESTAILIVLERQKVKDKGEIHENYISSLMIMGMENGEWKILSDIMGMPPKLSEEEVKNIK